MVELIENGFDRGGEVREIHDPAGGLVHRPGDIYGHRVGMAVEACSFVAGRHVGQAVGGIEGEFLEDLHVRFS